MPIDSLQNPFEIKPPEELTAELIHKLFIREFTEHNALIGNYHTFIYGSRGSGKSMHFKYLEPRCQAIEYHSLKEFFKLKTAFIGIYINCNKGDNARQEFRDLLLRGNKEIEKTIVEKTLTHYFVMDIAESILKTVIEQLDVLRNKSNEKRVVDALMRWLKIRKVKVASLAALKDVFYNEKIKVNDAIEVYFRNLGEPGNKFTIAITRFADVSLTDGAFLHTLLNAVRNEIIANESIPFYLLFDEANDLLDFQKRIINTLISQRKHSLASVKVSCQPLSYNISDDVQGRPIQETHDYYLMELDSLYTTDKNSYYNRLKKIAERRLEIASCKTVNIIKLLPENETEAAKIKDAEKATAAEYDALPPEKKPKSKPDYITKYSIARFYQEYLQKTNYGYTGFDNLVHFSSGIIRSFLEPCYAMLEEYIKRYPGVEMCAIETIPYEVQKDIIEDYSNSFITKEILNPLKTEPAGSERRLILEGLRNLLDSMGALFSARLMDKNSREPRIISFAIKEIARDPFLDKILDYGVQKAFFHQKWYRAKSGNAMLECFILNRRLCPRYHLDLSSFQGRIEVSQADLLVAIKDPKEFVRKYEKEPVTEQAQLQLFDF